MGVVRKQVMPYWAGCEVRRHGKAYLTTNSRKWLEKYPLSYFLYDPPILIDEETEKDLGICDQGISYIQDNNGIWHAQNVIGRSSYHNTADILMEIVNGWASALVPLIGDGVKNLTPIQSHRMIYHRGGYIDEFEEYRKQYKDLSLIQKCMLPDDDPMRPAHLSGEIMCASLHWQHVEGGSNFNNRYIVRQVGEAMYDAVAPIPDVKPTERLALVAWLPIDEIDVVDNVDIEDKSAINDALAFLAGMNSMPVYVTNN